MPMAVGQTMTPLLAQLHLRVHESRCQPWCSLSEAVSLPGACRIWVGVVQCQQRGWWVQLGAGGGTCCLAH